MLSSSQRRKYLDERSALDHEDPFYDAMSVEDAEKHLLRAYASLERRKHAAEYALEGLYLLFTKDKR